MKQRILSFLLAGYVLSSSVAVVQTKKSAADKSGLQAAMANGKQVYAARCLVCHQEGGTGVMNLNPPLIKTTYVLGDRTKLIQIVLKGLSGGIEINGDTYHNNMPALNILSDQEIADVLTYVRNSFGNKGSRVTPSEVKAVRAKTK